MIDRTARVLLSAGRAKEQGASLARRGLPYAVGVGLLFYSGYFERYLHHDPSGHALRLYLLTLLLAVCGLTAAHFAGATREILHRTMVFPVAGRVRFTFAAGGALANPVTAAFLFSAALSAAIVYGDTILLRLLSAANMAALLLLGQLCTILALLFPLGRRRSSILESTGLMVTLLLPGIADVVAAAPWGFSAPGWTADALLAAAGGNATQALLPLSYFAGALLLLAAAGGRHG